ncbi:hypothetical protein DUI87_30985 [Hirundo rustica rustica]|uniref:Reverse transcriptase domain-containing protein n=1 Tax=Hirundo rustica rustica TaxID=333673 RepID=A0A3M0JD80_HIRRU|nr:hypothetical protein DUI87_30985 [Hirundo rustica rustica]
MAQWGVTIGIPDDPLVFRAAASEERPTQKLNWKTDSPVWVEQWPLSKEKLKALQELVDEQLAKGHIVETTSPWNSPVFVIKKANKGKWRLLHDLCQINVIEDMGSLKPGMPSPAMLPQNWNLAIVDIKDCFFQIPLHPDDAPRFTFLVPTLNREAPMWEIRDRRSEDIALYRQTEPLPQLLVVLIVPRVLYHQEEEMYHFLEETILLHKREVITGVTIAMLLGLGATGTATGVSALVTQHQRLSQLQMTIDEDLLRIEKSISSLERSISSLSEVVLQNRRGLDLLLMQQGGLCAALREECCFYADHTGVVRDSMTELRGRLAQRKREREARKGWFESWFNQSPWLATLVPTLIGPLTMILLTLIFGPCILNKLVSFVRRRLDKVDILFVERMQLS